MCLWIPEEVLGDCPVDCVCCRHCCHVHHKSGVWWWRYGNSLLFSFPLWLWIMTVVSFFFSQVPYTYVEYDSNSRLWPGVRQAYALVDRYQLVNSYGLFRRMTGVGGRPEVVIEGSNDQVQWTVREKNSSWMTGWSWLSFCTVVSCISVHQFISCILFLHLGDWVYV